ncbi:gamma-glutamyl-gamma-aminobutyrate hydrolase family protein [Lacihabitans sp. LS3-19]|uniref:gamma-glutamyl-gamma-aminobutyrate hydrolase family protein n=1 Tax=Lacihabitans sp. LS3-19 TaxID=2487335 RepID=UPI0020CE489A|nr:gamma-glutamyl-gamma-aminobutyrate hydrolase family protein [Lacihabitans sp. LS3-19]MCP9767816.1 gamma-glutamyl-gamma-aminobutyrate hydrolase family protein [Lacihabitans sp. LS3-19]
MALKIGITQTETKGHNYPKWILDSGEEIELVELSYEKYNLEEISICDGVLFTGGIDIHPNNFIPDFEGSYPNSPSDFSYQRDKYEFEVLSICLEKKIPILGICRGLQLFNIFFDGTLVLDIGPEGCKAHKEEESKDKCHKVELVKDSMLNKIVKLDSGICNSAHHQVIDKLGLGLKIGAHDEQGLIEAIELINPENQFLMAVQWHPERIPDKESPLTKNIKEAFLAASKLYSNHVIVNI